MRSVEIPPVVLMPWRTGKSIGRTIYACPPGSSYRDGEIVLGMMDTPEIARHIVEIHNEWWEHQRELQLRS